MDWSKAGVQVAEALLPIVVALLGMLAAKLSQLISAHTHNARLSGILERLNGLAYDVARETAQTMVDRAKEVSADGRLPADVAKSALDSALAKLKSHLGVQGVGELEGVLGLKTDDAINAFLVTQIESAVNVIKARQ